jgi:outer membrane protein TolC
VNKLYLGNRVGASVRISLEEVFSYGSKSEKAEANIVMAEYNQKTLERELREVITSRYVKIQTTIRLVEIAMQGYNNSSIAKQNAELKFQSGELPVYDYSRILDLLTTASMTLERTRGELQLEWMVLEEIVGSPLNSLGSKQ